MTLTAIGMYLACLALESAGAIVARSVLASPVPPDPGLIPWWVPAWQSGSVTFVSLTVWYLASRLSNTLRKRDKELSAVNRRLIAATEERATHMLQTTHQLKAPFAAIHANAQLLLGGHYGSLPPEAIVVIGQIASRWEALSRGITSMLQLANLRSMAQSPPPPVEVDVSEVVRSCLTALRPHTEKRTILFEEDLSPAVVRVVQDHAVMIIDNVLSNAVNYSMDGQRIWVSSRAKPKRGATVVVCDCGIGIPPDKLPRVFDDYFRTSEAARHNRGSTGLGLATVCQTALAGGIGVHVESAPAHGTVFSLDFPDRADIMNGRHCKTISRTRERRPDAVILDVMFPENDKAGFEMARSIRRAFGELPVVLLTAVNQSFLLGFSRNDLDSTRLPAIDFVEKPVDFALLCRRISDMLAHAKGRMI